MRQQKFCSSIRGVRVEDPAGALILTTAAAMASRGHMPQFFAEIVRPFSQEVGGVFAFRRSLRTDRLPEHLYPCAAENVGDARLACGTGSCRAPWTDAGETSVCSVGAFE